MIGRPEQLCYHHVCIFVRSPNCPYTGGEYASKDAWSRHLRKEARPTKSLDVLHVKGGQ
jgi:hypothetical protein